MGKLPSVAKTLITFLMLDVIYRDVHIFTDFLITFCVQATPYDSTRPAGGGGRPTLGTHPDMIDNCCRWEQLMLSVFN